jgi:membrane fusion protein (multidrug efflux system)
MTIENDPQAPAAPHLAHGADSLGFALPAPTVLSKARILAFAAIGATVLGAAFVIGYLPKRHAKLELAQSTEEFGVAPLRVEVVSPKVVTSDHPIIVPGSVQPLEETVLFPQTNGYVKNWFVDIGDKVKEGQVLAEIATPELDQELDQARASLAQAEAGVLQANANREFSKVNLERLKQLVPAGVASQQDLEKGQAQSVVDEASVAVAKATVAVQEANVRRLTQSKSFAHVVAPFAGTITSRTIERGALVTTGNGTPLFKVSANDPARVFIQVPQDVAPGVRVGVPAKVTIREYGGRVFDGQVSRSAGALDAATRTMNTEIRVPNPNSELFAGMYAEVALTLPSVHRVFELPATALINDAKGLRVATVDAENKIRLLPIIVERDTGATVQISSGLTGNESVVKIAGVQLVDGRSAEVRRSPAP